MSSTPKDVSKIVRASKPLYKIFKEFSLGTKIKTENEIQETVTSVRTHSSVGDLFQSTQGEASALDYVLSVPDDDGRFSRLLSEIAIQGEGRDKKPLIEPLKISGKNLSKDYWDSLSKSLTVGKPDTDEIHGRAKNLKILYLEWVKAQAGKPEHDAQRRGTLFSTKEGSQVATGTKEIRSALKEFNARDEKGNLKPMPDDEVDLLYEQVCESIDNAQEKRGTGRTPQTKSFYNEIETGRDLLEKSFESQKLGRASALASLQDPEFLRQDMDFTPPAQLNYHEKMIWAKQELQDQVKNLFLSRVEALVNLHQYDDTSAQGVENLRKIFASKDSKDLYESVCKEIDATESRTSKSKRPPEVSSLYSALQSMKAVCIERIGSIEKPAETVQRRSSR